MDNLHELIGAWAGVLVLIVLFIVVSAITDSWNRDIEQNQDPDPPRGLDAGGDFEGE